jgi:hypothetical protein
MTIAELKYAANRSKEELNLAAAQLVVTTGGEMSPSTAAHMVRTSAHYNEDEMRFLMRHLTEIYYKKEIFVWDHYKKVWTRKG